MMEVVNAMLLLKLIISVLYVSIVDSVSSKCQTPLNSSDCGLPSTVVYTYYSPNSFCYPAIWRGCPTNNKFYNEDQCWKSCVMHFEVTESMPKEIDASKVQVQNNTKSQSVKINRCDVPLNTSRCTKKIKLVFTFSDVIKSCVIALWSGCPTENMFPDFTTCQNNCQEKKDDKLKQKDKSNIQQAPNFLQLDINNPNAQNKENKLVQKDESKMQEVPIDLKHLMKKPDASNEDIQIKQNYQSKVQKASNVPKKLVKKKNALNKEYKLDEKDIFKVTNNTKSQSVKIERCDVPLNTSRCTEQMKLVYTFNDVIKSCIMAVWSGCPTENMFPDFTTCQDNCQEKNDNKMKQKDNTNNIQLFSKAMKNIHTPNKDNKLVQKDEKIQEVPIDLINLMKKADAPNEENKIEQNKKSKVQKSLNVPKKLIKKINALNKENKLNETDLFNEKIHPIFFKNLIKKMEALKKEKKSGKNIDLNATAYFIYKLVKANMELDERTKRKDIELMLPDEYLI